MVATGFSLQGLDHVAIEVADLDAAERWYAEVLGLERAIRSGTRRG